MSRATSYRIVLPKPWVRIPVNDGLEDRVREVADEVAARAPKDVPPDQIGPWRREIERRLVADIKRSREYGGVDFYLPTDTLHGFLVGASFVVSEITPPGLTPDDSDVAVGDVLAQIASTREGALPITVGDTVWARSERVAQPEAESVSAGIDVRTRRVDYVTAVPGDPRRWITVAFSCAGDGDPDSELSHLVVELFDAMMSTWRWMTAEDQGDVRLA